MHCVVRATWPLWGLPIAGGGGSLRAPTRMGRGSTVRELSSDELLEVAGGASEDEGEGFHEVPMDPNPMTSPELKHTTAGGDDYSGGNR